MASEINRLNSVNPVVSARHQHEQENLTARKRQKQHVKEEIIKENVNKNIEADERSFKEIAAQQYFSKETEGGRLQQTRESIPPQLLELYESGFSDAQIANNVSEMSYLTGEEIESFLSFIDVDGKKKLKFDELSKRLSTAHEGEEEGLIDHAAQTICANKSEIYLMLCYLLEDLVRKKSKDKLQERLKKIIDAFERQESAYLFNFFSFQNILKTSPNASVSASTLDKMANISSGNMKLNSLRQSLQFVAQTFSDKDMHKMVSLFMKFQARNIKKISNLSEGREDKEELSNILQQERNLIILNSLYNQCKRVFMHLKKETLTLTPAITIEEKYSDFMAQIITVIESSIVSLDGLLNMERLIGIKQITPQINHAFVKNFQVLLAKMPQPIFYNEAMREKLLESIKGIMRNIEKHLEPTSVGLSFLRKKGLKRSNV